MPYETALFVVFLFRKGMLMNRELWEKCVAFHGHECPGLAIGFKACEAAVEKLGLEFAPDEEVVCVTENDACGIDAVQVITGCTAGKGNLIYHGTGKMAFSFFSRASGESLRLIKKPFPGEEEMDRPQRQAYILNAPADAIFQFGKPKFELPQKARLFQTVSCEICGEGAPEHKMRLQNGQQACLDCFEDYSRGW
jgi:formylmethanofuran dehydrogenase subunit E